MKKKIYFLMIALMLLVFPSFSLGASSPNEPVLASNMVKVGNDGNEIYTMWYDYDNGEWAHAKTVDGTIWVWIPRFTYKVDGDEIFIKWSSGYEDDYIEEGYKRHPAFFFGGYKGGDPNDNKNYYERNGERRELTGFWVQKSTNSTKKNFNEALDSCMRMTSDTKYGLSPAGTYTHLVKASEWGAIAYLAKSIEGDSIIINETEYVASVVGDTNTLGEQYLPYYDLLDNRRVDEYFGFAFTETLNIDSFEKKIIPDESNPYLVRGGELGLLGYDKSNGNDELANRAVIAIFPNELGSEVAFFDTEADVVEGDYLEIGVDFIVNEPWSFIDEDFLKVEGNEKADVDLELVYEDGQYSSNNLNAKFLKLLYEEDDKLVEETKDSLKIGSGDTYQPGKYTMQVRIGGEITQNDVPWPVFDKIEELSSKIVVNEIKLQDKDGKELKVGNILNNKILLNIYGEEGTLKITRVILSDVPVQSDIYGYVYSLGEELNLNGGTITPYYGIIKGRATEITMDHVVDKGITNSSGIGKKVELIYGGWTVDQTENPYTITVDSSSLINVDTKINPEGIGYVLKGSGKYKQKEEAENYPLVASSFLNGYKFNKWSIEADTNQITYNDQNNSNTTFNIPSKNVEISDKDITFVANYFTPNYLRVEDQKKEFVLWEEFNLGESGKLYIDYSSNIKEYINLKSPGVLVYLDNQLLDSKTLTEVGKKKITIKYNPIREINIECSYDIEVVQNKHELQVEIGDKAYGEITGQVLDSESVEKSTILVPDNDSTISKYDISVGNTVKLKATPKIDDENQYAFIRWIVSDENLVLTSGKLDTDEITFVMPDKDINIYAEFDEGYNITYKIHNTHKEYGDIIYDGKIDEDDEVVQFIPRGGSTKEVEIKPIEGYMFNQWNDRTSINPRKDENVTQDEVYTARIIKTHTVEYYDGEELKYKEVVKNYSYSTPPAIGPKDTAEGVIDPATKGYILEGWKKDGELVNLEEYKITEDTKFYASWLPRIEIKDPKINSYDYIVARIKGNSIKDGTLKYIIADSTEKLEDYIYITNEIENSEGSWETGNVGFQSKEGLGATEDSSSTIVITSQKDRETVTFSYILSASENSELGFTINGERVIFEKDNTNDWKEFSKEIDVKDGKIIIGISYSQPESYKGTDYAAIKDIRLENKWTVISNDYRLYVPKLYGNNYIHVKGTGAENDIVYYKVSELLQKRTTTNYTQEDIDNSDGLLVAIGATDPLYVVAAFNEDFSEVTITKNGENSDGIIEDYKAYVSVGKSCMNQNSETLTSAIIEDGVTSIGKYLFNSCSNLQTVQLPYSLTIIGVGAFSETGITNLVIPNSVNTIGTSAFEAAALENVTLSSNITIIDNYTFAKCKLTSLVIPYGVQTIGSDAFKYCKFTEVTIPNSVTVIKSDAFSSCSNLTDIIFNGTVAEWNAISKSSNWDMYTDNYTIHCTDGDITK